MNRNANRRIMEDGLRVWKRVWKPAALSSPCGAPGPHDASTDSAFLVVEIREDTLPASRGKYHIMQTFRLF
jgi:hypothetical protein